MSTATEYRPQSLTGRLPSKRVYRRSAVNTGFRGTFVRDNYRSCCIKDSVLLDPTCCSGGFLIKAFEYMREKIEEEVKKAKAELRSVIEGDNYDSLSEEKQIVINERIEAMQSTLNKELDTQVEGSRMYNLSRNCIYGTDANPRMARTSKMNIIMHGDGHDGVHHHDGLLNVNGILEERFDVILTNPPFGARIDKSQKITEVDKFTDATLIAKYKAKNGEAYEKALKQVNDNIDIHYTT